MSEKGFLIGPAFAGALKELVDKDRGGVSESQYSRIETRFEEPIRPPGDTPRLAAYARTAVWAKGKTMAVTFYTHSGTAFGLSSSGTAGTATALNVSGEFLVLPNGDANEAIGPTPTMTWCIIGKSKGGANVALEAQQPPIRLAAYEIAGGPWGKGERRNIAFYDVVGGNIVFSGVTATAGNVSQTFYPMSTVSSGTAVGPTPTMAWAVVSQSPSGQLIAVEAENDPVVRLATWQSSGEWQRGSLRTVKITGTTRTEDVYSNFDYYSELDLQHGLVYAKTAYTPAGGTANVVIGPPPVPLHAAKYEGGDDWQRGQERLITVLPSDNVRQAREIVAVNQHFDTIEASNKPLAIGKIGTAYHVIAGPEGSSVKAGSRTDFGDKDYFWQRGSTWYIDPAGSEQSVPVKSVFDTYTHLDLHDGVAFVKTKDPDDSESTVNIVISPAPTPMYEATTEETGTWDQDDEKVLTVPSSGGRRQSLDVRVTNKFFEEIELEGQPIAIGKFNDQFFALTGGSGSKVYTGTLATPISSGIPLQPGDVCYVTPAGGGPAVEVKSVFDAYTVLDLPNGLAYAKAKDPDNVEQTVNIVISPAPIPMHAATADDTSEWERDAERLMTVQPYGGRQNEEFVTVTNKFFDSIEVDENPLAVGKFGDKFFALTGGSSSAVKMADRSGTGVWNKGSQRSVKFQGTTTEVQAYNLVGDYEDFDGRSSGGMPGLALAKGKDLGGSGGTAWYVISPPAITFRTGTFTGRWTKGQTKSITLTSSPTGTISVINNFGAVGTTASGSRNCAMSKEGTEWYLIAAECA
jgi:hypothetical protein